MINLQRAFTALTIAAMTAAFASPASAAALPTQKPTRELPTPHPHPAPCKTRDVRVIKTVCTPSAAGPPVCRRILVTQTICK